MATYQELSDLAGSNILIDRVARAITVAADTILNEPPATTNHANRLVWAKSAFLDPSSQAKSFLNALLAANKDATIPAIQSVNDSTIQTHVDAAIDIFAGSA